MDRPVKRDIVSIRTWPDFIVGRLQIGQALLDVAFIEARGQVELLDKIQIAFHFTNVDIALCPGKYATIADCPMHIAIDKDRIGKRSDIPFLSV